MKQMQLPRKWASKKTTGLEEAHITEIQQRIAKETGKPVPWLQAKHEYFENQTGPQAEVEPPKEAEKPVIDHRAEYKVGKIKMEKPAKERKTMTIGETKLGVTLVLSKEDCEQLGFSKSDTTKEVIKEVKRRLGVGE